MVQKVQPIADFTALFSFEGDQPDWAINRTIRDHFVWQTSISAATIKLRIYKDPAEVIRVRD